MQETLIYKLHEYIMQNNPDVLLSLEENNSVTTYLNDKVNPLTDLITQLQKENKPAYIVEEICMEELTKDLRPSRYNYIVDILEEDFASTYNTLNDSGTLLHEVVNLIDYCKPVFESIEFTEENEDSRQLRYAVVASINEYLSK